MLQRNRFTWVVRCSVCGLLINPDDCKAHAEMEQAKPSFPGWISFTRVDLGR
jgi:hypothetical protein